jgi:hypothetical protein
MVGRIIVKCDTEILMAVESGRKATRLPASHKCDEPEAECSLMLIGSRYMGWCAAACTVGPIGEPITVCWVNLMTSKNTFQAQ